MDHLAALLQHREMSGGAKTLYQRRPRDLAPIALQQHGQLQHLAQGQRAGAEITILQHGVDQRMTEAVGRPRQQSRTAQKIRRPGIAPEGIQRQQRRKLGKAEGAVQLYELAGRTMAQRREMMMRRPVFAIPFRCKAVRGQQRVAFLCPARRRQDVEIAQDADGRIRIQRIGLAGGALQQHGGDAVPVQHRQCIRQR